MNIDPVYVVSVVLVIVFAMTMHEAMHAFVGYWLGDYTAKDQGRLSLNPLRHIDPYLSLLLPVVLAIVGAPIFGAAKPVPFNPYNLRWGEWGMALVAVAGPLTNLLIAFISFGLWVLIGANDNSFLGLTLVLSVYVNIGFFVFNMIPIPPLDGSRLLYVIAPDSIRIFMSKIEQYGLIVVLMLVLLGGQFISALLLGSLDFFIQIFSAIFSM